MKHQTCPVAPVSVEELLSNALQISPYEALGQLQQDAPVHQVGNLPWYLVTRYDVCNRVLRDARNFSSEFREFGGQLAAIGLAPSAAARARMIEVGGDRGMMFEILLHRDPPAHSRQRRLINHVLTARTSRWEGFIVAQVRRLIEKLEVEGEADFMEALAVPLPVAVIADILGVGEDVVGSIKQWSDTSVKVAARLCSDEDWIAAAAAMKAQSDFFEGELRERLENPSDDLVGVLAEATRGAPDPETGDQPMNFAEALEMLILLLIAGNETTTQLVGRVLLDLAKNDGLLEAVRNDPNLVPNVVEESVRLASPVPTIMRFVKSDTEIDGFIIPGGSIVSVCFNQANRDAGQYQCPHALDPHRDAVRRHLGFGAGIHTCPGAPLARLEARTVVREVSELFSGLELAGPDAVKYEMASMGVRGMTHLRLRYSRRLDVEAGDRPNGA